MIATKFLTLEFHILLSREVSLHRALDGSYYLFTYLHAGKKHSFPVLGREAKTYAGVLFRILPLVLCKLVGSRVAPVVDLSLFTFIQSTRGRKFLFLFILMGPRADWRERYVVLRCLKP